MIKEQHNQYQRLITLIGDNNLNKLKETSVLIVGLGGVGGYVVESLARCGIGTIGIVDYDVVDVTNINRQIIALHSTIGLKKVELFKDRIKDINKTCNVICYDMFLNENNFLSIFDNNYDFVVDCCDHMEAKKCLLLESIKRKIDYISSMGTANKLDPSKLKIIELSKTSYDPIAKIMRKFVKEKSIKQKIMVLSSDEEPIKTKGNLGSNSFVPPTAGLLIASYIVNKIINNS